MAVKFDKGVILAADSRTTTGTYIANRVTDKLTQIHDTIYCCRSGSAADTQAIADIVKYYLQLYSSQLPNGEQPETKIAANVFQELCYNNKDNLTAGIIVAGYDKKTDSGSVFQFLLVVVYMNQNMLLQVVVQLIFMVYVIKISNLVCQKKMLLSLLFKL